MTRLYEEITHLIPCAICPTKHSPIQLGPVRFIHASTFNKGAYNVPSSAEEYAFQDLDAILKNRSANWIAEVRLSRLIRNPSTELGLAKLIKQDEVAGKTKANLFVDIAIGCIQATIGQRDLEISHRLTARAMPTYYSGLQIKSDGCPRISVHNNQPGLALASFGDRLYENRKTLNQMSSRMSEFSNPDSAFPKINEAWCSAVYWYHQALAEPIDTIRIVKLETAIEILFCAESSGGSKKKITEALARITGHDPTGEIKFHDTRDNTTETKSVEEFAKQIVEARSRVLHGTLPTFGQDGETIFDKVEWLARTLIIGSSQTIELYQNAPNAKDTVKDLLAHPIAALHHA